jgi:hypothetical protein
MMGAVAQEPPPLYSVEAELFQASSESTMSGSNNQERAINGSKNQVDMFPNLW